MAKNGMNIGVVLLAIFAIGILAFMTGNLPLGAALFDKNGDGIVDSEDIRFCVENRIDCDYSAMITFMRGGTPLAGISDSCTQSELETIDDNKDCIISDFELLDTINLWDGGAISDFCLLNAIEDWDGEGNIEGCISQAGTTLPSDDDIDDDGGIPFTLVGLVVAIVILIIIIKRK